MPPTTCTRRLSRAHSSSVGPFTPTHAPSPAAASVWSIALLPLPPAPGNVHPPVRHMHVPGDHVHRVLACRALGRRNGLIAGGLSRPEGGAARTHCAWPPARALCQPPGPAAGLERPCPTVPP